MDIQSELSGGCEGGIALALDGIEDGREVALEGVAIVLVGLEA